MSTIHPAIEPNPESAFVWPLWYINIYERTAHTNGDTYYQRAPTAATGVARAVLLHPRPFEKITVELCDWAMDQEVGYGIGEGREGEVGGVLPPGA